MNTRKKAVTSHDSFFPKAESKPRCTESKNSWFSLERAVQPPNPASKSTFAHALIEMDALQRIRIRVHKSVPRFWVWYVRVLRTYREVVRPRARTAAVLLFSDQSTVKPSVGISVFRTSFVVVKSAVV